MCEGVVYRIRMSSVDKIDTFLSRQWQLGAQKLLFWRHVSITWGGYA